MEKLVLTVYGFWFWLTRKDRTAVYREAAAELAEARTYLYNDYATRASTIDRGTLLPMHIEALDLLERHSTVAAQSSTRFDSIRECYRFITEELAQLPPTDATAVAVAVHAESSASSSNPMASFVAFLHSEEKASPSEQFDARLFRWKVPFRSAVNFSNTQPNSANSPKLQTR